MAVVEDVPVAEDVAVVEDVPVAEDVGVAEDKPVVFPEFTIITYIKVNTSPIFRFFVGGS